MLQPQFFIAILMVMLALAVACWADATPPAPASSDSIETARRDLKNLSSAERELVSRSQFKKSDLPTLVVTPGLMTRPSETSPAASASTDGQWLAEGLKQTELEHMRSSARDMRSGVKGELENISGKTGDTSPGNMLDSYLTQWLSPKDQAIFKSTDTNSFQREVGHTNFEMGNNGTSDPMGFAGGSAATVTPFPAFNATGQSNNPYLESMQPATMTATRPMTATAPVATMPSSLAAQSREMSGDFGSAASQREAKTLPQPAAAQIQPTAPLVNDQKYFPQLRRF